MGEAAFALPASPKRKKPREEWAKDFTDAEIRRALERHDLDAREHMLLERLCGLSLQQGYAWLNQDDLAALVRCSVRTLYDTTTRLCKRGLLETTLTLRGLHYFPQWSAIGLERDGQRSAKSADPDRQNLPMLLRSRNSGSRNSENSSRRSSTRPALSPSALSEAAAASSSSALHPGAHQKRPSRTFKASSEPRVGGPFLGASERSPAPQATAGAPLQHASKPAAVPKLTGPRLLSVEEAEEADRELAACRDTLAAELATVAVADPAAGSSDCQAITLVDASSQLELGDEDEFDTAIVIPPLAPLGRVPPPAAAIVAPDRLGQVLEKFGPEAHADALEVLGSWPARQNPDAAMDALTRLLELDPSEIQKSAGACFRSYLRLACAGQLRLAKTHPRGGTLLHRLERERDAAAQRRDFDAANAIKEKMFSVGQHVQEQVAALRQLEPTSRAFSVSTQPACKVLRLPESAPRKAPRCLPPPPAPSQERVADALRAQLMLRYLTPGQRAKLEQELAEVEAAMAASSSPESISTTTEEPHAQQGQQARP
jgi:hypothetical protein